MATVDYLGLHLVQTLRCRRTDLMCDAARWRDEMRRFLVGQELGVMAEAFHVFENGGFTATFCLMESHVCVHTWPEHAVLTFDVFLCNHSRNNEDKTRAVAAFNVAYFEGAVLHQAEIKR